MNKTNLTIFIILSLFLFSICIFSAIKARHEYLQDDIPKMSLFIILSIISAVLTISCLICAAINIFITFP